MKRQLGNAASVCAILAIVLFCIACGEKPAPISSVTQVTNDAQSWTDSTAWQVDATPTLVLGAQERDGAITLANVTGAARLDDGSIVVLDAAEPAIRVFGADGRFERNIGKAGSGPGEFRDVCCLLARGDTLAVYSSRLRRLLAFHRNGTYLASAALTTADPLSFSVPIAFTNDPDVVVKEERLPRPGIGSPGETFRDTITFRRYHLTRKGTDWTLKPGAVLATAPGPQMYVPRQGKMYTARSVPFGPTNVFAFHDDRLYVGSGERWLFTMHGLGGAAVEVSRSAEPHELSDQEFDRIRQLLTNSTSTDESGRAAPAQTVARFWTDLLAEMPRPKHLPAFSSLVVDEVGNAWFQQWQFRPESATKWSVFERDGKYLGDVTLPAHFRPTQIGKQHLLGVQIRDDGVQTVALYQRR